MARLPMITRDELLEKLRHMIASAKIQETHNRRYDSQQRAKGARLALRNVRELVKMLPREAHSNGTKTKER